MLVRHGEAAAGWGDDLDPGLSERGRAQADAVAAALDPFGRCTILTSPMRRCRETAAPLASRWGIVPAVDPLVGEIESPDPDLAVRAAWLSGFLRDAWPNVDDRSRAWRQRVVDRLLTIDFDAVVFTHFVAINVAIGEATGDERIVCRHVDNCSTTVVRNDGGLLTIDELPSERATRVL